MENHDNGSTDAAFVERVRGAWGRPALTDRERAAFDAGVRARLGGRRWVPRVVVGTIAAALAAVALVMVSGDQGPPRQASWIDSLAEAQAVAAGDKSFTEGYAAGLYGFDREQASDALFADPTWDSSADTVWDSAESSLALGYEYRVLAFWLAPPSNNDDSATSAQGVQ
jgi:hypothetical protein